MDKEKILYISHIDWNFIKQRPQFIAEGLEAYFDLSIYCISSLKKCFQKRKENVHPIFDVPKKNSNTVAHFFDVCIKKFVIRRAIRKANPEYIYLTFPTLFDYVPANYQGKIIYDCMDNHIGFHALDKNKKRVINSEQALVKRSDYVFFTSEKLKKEIISRYDFNEKKAFLNRNAYNGDCIDDKEFVTDKSKATKDFYIAYFGAIDKWFDFDMIQKSLDYFPNFKYLLIGPIGTEVKKLENERIEYTGAVPHSKLFEMTKHVDCFIIPFKINELIESVDPVKIYEYINFNKNILCVYWAELDRYKNFVHFYRDEQSFISTIQNLCNDRGVSFSNDKRKEFLGNNTWTIRCSQIVEILKAGNQSK